LKLIGGEITKISFFHSHKKLIKVDFVDIVVIYFLNKSKVNFFFGHSWIF
jgi:hypothetical protein